MINIPKDEIDNFISTNKGIRWVTFLENNFIPSDVIIKHKKRIFVTGDHRKVAARQILIAEMFERNNEKMSTELFEIFMGDPGTFVFGQVGEIFVFDVLKKVFDVEQYLDTVSLKIVTENHITDSEYRSLATVYNIHNLHNEFSIKAFKLIQGTHKYGKQDKINLFIQNYFKLNISEEEKNKYNKDYVDFMISTAREHYESSLEQECYIPNIENVLILFGIDEVIERSTPEKLIIHSFKYNDTHKYIENSKEVADKLVLKMLSTERDIEEMKKELEPFYQNISFVAEHSSYSAEVYNKFLKNKAILYTLMETLDWDDISYKFDEFTVDERKLIFSRTDVPDWFTNKYSAQLMHLVFLNQKETIKYASSYKNQLSYKGFFS